MGQYVRVEIDLNDGSETQSMVTNATRFMNYRITPRAAFYGSASNEPRSRQTMLVPEANQARDQRFRNSVNSNYGRSRAVTARSESVAGDTRTVHVIDVAMNSNGFSTYGVQPGASVAKYKMVRDAASVGDTRLLDQESTSLKNTHSLVFYIIVVLMLCVGCAVASYITFMMTSSAALNVFIMFVVGVPLDMFGFRVLLCAVVSCALKCMTKKS